MPPPTRPPPTPSPGMAWPGLTRIPPSHPLSAEPTARPRSGCECFGSRYTCWPAVRQREPLRASGAWLRPASLIRKPSNSQKEAPQPDPTCLQTFSGRDPHSTAPAGRIAAAHVLIINIRTDKVHRLPGAGPASSPRPCPSTLVCRWKWGHGGPRNWADSWVPPSSTMSGLCRDRSTKQPRTCPVAGTEPQKQPRPLAC